MADTIFNIVHSNNSGGMENVYLDYTNILTKNFNVICITSKNFIHLDKIKEKNIQTETLNVTGHYDFIAAIKLFFLIRKYSPKLIIAHNGRSFAVVNLYKKLFYNTKSKTLAISHGGRIKRLLNFDYIITVAKHLAEPIREAKFKGVLSTIYNGIHIQKTNKKTQKNKPITFGILSRLSQEKNIDTAINAFAMFIQRTDISAKLLIAGDGPELEQLQKNVRQKKLQEKVIFSGWVSDKKKFFNDIDIFLQPAFNEPFGLTILESFNYHVPVISVNAGGPKEIINHNHNGYLYHDPSSASELYDVMHEVYNNREDILKITKNAYKDLENKFSYKHLETELLSLIKNITK